MSQYTTGEMAKLCNVSVRTVQYYDNRGILIPDELSEGGRRIYSEENLLKLKTICFLRSIGISIDNIYKIYNDKNTKEIIQILLEEQEKSLKSEIEEKDENLQTIKKLKQAIKAQCDVSPEYIQDIAITMKKQKNLSSVHIKMLIIGIIMDIIAIIALLLWIIKGIWWPFALAAVILIIMGCLLTKYYYQNTAYICPNCHKQFKPKLKQFIFSAHTPKTRKLSCTNCNHTGYCVEVYQEKQ